MMHDQRNIKETGEFVCVILMKCVLQCFKGGAAIKELRLTLNCTKILRTFCKNK
jgi:hypothetical protein